jgi:lipopolysaccharide biosynthesis regulator YciM
MRLIDADVLKVKAHKEFQYLEITLKDIDGLIKSAPTIETPRGKWDLHNNSKAMINNTFYTEWYTCSECGARQDNVSYYCPYCGAKMEGMS